jgi:LysM repeat protein
MKNTHQRYILLIIILLISINTYAQSPSTFIEVTVTPKQTFFSISRDFNVNVNVLKKYNEEFAPAYELKIGDIVKIPVFETKNATSPKSFATFNHTVVKGETAYGIIKKYGITIDELKKWNNLDNSLKLSIGQKLIIKKEKTTPTIEQSKPIVKEKISSEAIYVPKEKRSDDLENLKIKKNTPVIVPTSEEPKESNLKNTSFNPRTIIRGIGKTSDNTELSNPNFAFYNYAKTGQTIKVTNLLSKKIVYLKVIAKIPQEEQVSEDIVLLTSKEIIKSLGTNDNRFLVEIATE